MPFRSILLVTLALLVSVDASAQETRDVRMRGLRRAVQLAGNGETALARWLVDSLVATAPVGGSEIPDLLFARASLAARAANADSDYRRIIAEFSTSPRREESLFRLAQQAFIEDDRQTALKYLQQLSADYRSDSSQARANYWLANVLIDNRDLRGACAASDRALYHIASADPALRTRIQAQASSNCPTKPDTAVTPMPMGNRSRVPARVNPSAIATSSAPIAVTRGSYAVQVAAFATRPGAEQFAASLRKSGLEARVDGSTQPFRVRIGRYATYAEAVAAQRDLKLRKISGFLVEVKP